MRCKKYQARSPGFPLDIFTLAIFTLAIFTQALYRGRYVGSYLLAVEAALAYAKAREKHEIASASAEIASASAEIASASAETASASVASNGGWRGDCILHACIMHAS